MKKRYIISGIFFLLFITIAILMITNNTKVFDDTIYNYIFSFRNNYLDMFFKAITKFGNTITVIVLVVLLVIFLERKNMWQLLITVGITVLTNQLLKHIIRRVRPDHLRLIKEDGFSFPSGHSMISIALYGTLIYITYKCIKKKFIKTIIIVLLTILILGIGISRIYLGVHYPSDVLGGYFLATSILILVVTIIDNHFRGNINDKDSSK